MSVLKKCGRNGKYLSKMSMLSYEKRQLLMKKQKAVFLAFVWQIDIYSLVVRFLGKDVLPSFRLRIILAPHCLSIPRKSFRGMLSPDIPQMLPRYSPVTIRNWSGWINSSRLGWVLLWRCTRITAAYNLTAQIAHIAQIAHTAQIAQIAHCGMCSRTSNFRSLLTNSGCQQG